MTNYEKIKNYTIEEMAEDRIQTFQGYAGARKEYYGDFGGYKGNREEALKAEIKWLKKESC